MKDYQQRVVDERAELAAKHDRLIGFSQGDVFHALPAEEQVLLSWQSSVMAAYLSVLARRISLFKE